MLPSRPLVAYLHMLCTPAGTWPDTLCPPASQDQDSTADGKKTLVQELETVGEGQRQHPRSPATTCFSLRRELLPGSLSKG